MQIIIVYFVAWFNFFHIPAQNIYDYRIVPFLRNSHNPYVIRLVFTNLLYYHRYENTRNIDNSLFLKTVTCIF
jgi:hypothetical protein